MQKQLKMLESLPAREVNLFMEENQVKAASKIQAAFRGMVARKKYRERNEEVTRERAAVTIQRQVSVGIFIFGNFGRDGEIWRGTCEKEKKMGEKEEAVPKKKKKKSIRRLVIPGREKVKGTSSLVILCNLKRRLLQFSFVHF